MDYAEAKAIFLVPPAEERTPPPLPDTPARRLRDAAEAIATVSWWGPPVNERLAALGLDFITGYVWGRTAPMGEPVPQVVVAAFGVFETAVLTSWYEEGRAKASRADVLAAREEGVVETLRAVLGDADVTEAVGLLRAATDVCAADLAGRPLFAGQVSLPWPADPLGQLWHACTLLREYRGDVHIAANVAAGISGVQMNLLTEYWIGWAPTAYAGTRGWAPEVMAAADAELAARGLVADGRLTEEGRRLRDGIEQRTDAALRPALDAVGPELDGLIRQLEEWSDAVVAAGVAPPDLYKRVSG
ncbi:SCO6745 family protein [Geodermatophilus sp. URMC 64]